jgi:tRNA pseudouridine38-40 synthase
VASFEVAGAAPPDLARRLNSVLPREISVLDAQPASEGFDARRDARSRVYCYRLLAAAARDPFLEGRALWWPHPLDRDGLERCASALVGLRDFTAFTPTQTEHVRFERRVLAAEWRFHSRPQPFPGELVEFWIEADAFMRHMVRVLVGTMLEVGGGRRDVEGFTALLAGAARDEAGDTAPAHGLYLAAVRY